MKVSGFTIARQAVALHYPLAESIRSLLPIVDEYIIGVDAADQETWDLVNALGDPRIKPFRSSWDLSSRGGRVLSQETNKALDRCTGEWAVYLQADEVIHERDLPALQRALEDHVSGSVEGLTFLYHHFYGSFSTIQDDPVRFYRRATRAVRTHVGVRSAGDACAFEVHDGERAWLLRRADLPIHIYHYGWVRPPDVMLEKNKRFDRMYHDVEWLEQNRPYPSQAEDVYSERGNLRPFHGSHPAVMRERVATSSWRFDPRLESQPPEWIRRARAYSRWAFSRVVGRIERRRRPPDQPDKRRR